MNAPNRVTNRIFLVLMALVLLAVSAYAIALAVPRTIHAAVAADAANTVETVAKAAGSLTIQESAEQSTP